MTDTKSPPVLLLIDDDDDFVMPIQVLLERSGYCVHRAADGLAGVEMARKHRPDIILLDYLMPVMTGFEACVEIRQIEELRDVPILVMTAFGQNVGELHGMGQAQSDLLIQDCLEKPLEINVLLDRLAAALAKARA